MNTVREFEFGKLCKIVFNEVDNTVEYIYNLASEEEPDIVSTDCLSHVGEPWRPTFEKGIQEEGLLIEFDNELCQDIYKGKKE